MTFYTDLRDTTVAPLIAELGMTATYRVHGVEAYDNTTGKVVKGPPTDTTIRVLELPARRMGSNAGQEFSEETVKRMSAVLLVSAKEFADASVTPTVDETLIYDARTTRILEIKRIAPAGVAVAYKMAVQNV